jgi:hypothetical protein
MKLITHRRQHTPRRRVVTPQTRHGMVRGCVRQQILSQDMIDETLAHANHCFFLFRPTQKAITHKPQTLKLLFSRKWQMQ